MRRTAALTLLVSAATFAAGSVSGAVAASAPPDPGPRGPAVVQPAGSPAGDRDGDLIADELEAALAAASPEDRLDVIVEGVRPGPARSQIGAFELGFDLPIIDGFSASMTAAQVRGLLHVPGLTRISADGVVRALDDAGNRDFGVDAARTDNVGSTGAQLDGRGIGICVVDTGVRPDHEQLSGRVVGFFDAINGRAGAYDDHGHGTHVSGIALGDGTAPDGASESARTTAARAKGVAPAALLYAAKVLNSQGSGQDSQVLAGIDWCVQRKSASPPVRVISMSLGDAAVTGGSDPMSTAVNNAVSTHGLVVVVAAGNSGDAPYSINSPGFAADAITVGAVADWSAPTTAASDTGIWLAGFSSRGPVSGSDAVKPDIAAPGVSVLSATPASASSYEAWSGTSMATPFVAGAVALALQADPATTPAQLKAALMATALDRGPAGTDNDWGAGLIDVRALVDAVEDTGVPVVTSVRTGFPTMDRLEGAVGPHESKSFTITVPAGGDGVPLALTMTITSGDCGSWCLLLGPAFGEWSPDLDMELLDANGRRIAVSECTLAGLSCGIGRQETIGVRLAAGDYTLRVYEWTGGAAVGGTFRVDISRGPQTLGAAPQPDDHKAADGTGSDGGGGGGQPVNQAPTANAGEDQTCLLTSSGRKAKCAFTLHGSGSTDPDGSITGWAWSLGGKTVGTDSTLSQSKPAGTYTYTLTVTDAGGLSASDSVVVTVRR